MSEFTPKNIAAIAAAMVAVSAAAHLVKDWAIGALESKQEADRAAVDLHLACWAQASLSSCEKQLAQYTYCRYGAVSKRKVQ